MSTLSQRLAALKPYFRGTLWAVALGGLGAAISAACESALAWLMVPLVDGGLKKPPIPWLPDLMPPPYWAIPILLIVIFLVRGIAGFIVDYSLAWTANRGALALRRRLFERVLQSDGALFGERTGSSLTNTVVYEAINGIAQLVSALQTLLKDSFTVVALLITLLLLNWQLTAVILALAPVLAITMRYFSRRMRRITLSSQTAVDRLGYVVEENVLAWRVVRLHGVQRPQAERFETESRSLFRLMLKSTAASATVTPLIQLFTAMALAIIIAVALWQNSQTGGSMGTFVAFITTAIGIATPIRRLTDVSSAVTRGLAALERGQDLIHTSQAESGGTHAVDRTAGHLTFRGVGVRYGAADAPAALTDIDLDVPQGSTVALVGPSGAGKTTLINLLPRFIEPSTGTISLDGVPLKDWSLASLRSQIALVSQDVVLLNGTVRDNVCLSSETPDPARVRAALQASNLLELVDGLPEGLDTLVGHNGTKLSGGQRQRLAIARAIYKDAPIIILDEATSALDSESERLIQQAMDNLMRDRTSIVIAHRLSTIANADKVVVLEAGRVVEQGTQAELLQKNGLFAKLHGIQFGTR
ncbi:lipid A export permease/ATP-binding protein MsbA [Piscinibacter gummiphilus]|uniref:Lipid ABC transporter permease/ATP-binding protein n=1 Tax=Piscinibacter gummiphilus TaxID=946333 RepID=A0A1W6L7T4_9BURK|nr:lipid A export permease/ATP-binding protein MsbA [Piscinibacter gummiphilus]ARN20284.1 lipid ABC transporter permease/ATP-binding protein [Piscinibacter gummiphilus]ATU64955.1 lipid A export permease/ATP-binding protein MsbA [Piscinibacter gummiphilus]GLS96410.1 lipid A export ATP-binding/permease protein MsbA [Piscinibacter gummiphilus]